MDNSKWHELNEVLENIPFKKIKEVCNSYQLPITKSQWVNSGGLVLAWMVQVGITRQDFTSEKLVLCVLQNAWGNTRLPLVFKPNPYNKSAKVIRKVVGHNNYLFANTTPVVTRTAKGRSIADPTHLNRLLQHIRQNNALYSLILVCGKQAEKAVKEAPGFAKCGLRVVYVKHPAARDLSNVEINKYNKIINK